MGGFSYAGGQITGGRARQEDTFRFTSRRVNGEDELLLTLCDGAGGYLQGQLASQLATESFVEHFWRGEGRSMPRLSFALEQANARLRMAWMELERKVPLVTTIVAVHVFRGVAHWVSIGDSPLYVWRRSSLKRLNADHSVQDPSRPGVRSNTLRYALTYRPIEAVDRSPRRGFSLGRDAKLVCASDGVFTLSDQRICETLNVQPVSVQGAVDGLLEEVSAVGKPRQDNTTVAVVARQW